MTKIAVNSIQHTQPAIKTDGLARNVGRNSGLNSKRSAANMTTKDIGTKIDNVSCELDRLSRNLETMAEKLTGKPGPRNAALKAATPANTGSPKLPTVEEICRHNNIDSVDSNYGGVVREVLDTIRQLRADA